MARDTTDSKIHAAVRVILSKKIEIVPLEDIKQFRSTDKTTYEKGKIYHWMDWQGTQKDDFLVWKPIEIYAVGSKQEMNDLVSQPERFRPTVFHTSDLSNLSLTDESRSNTRCSNEFSSEDESDNISIRNPSEKDVDSSNEQLSDEEKEKKVQKQKDKQLRERQLQIKKEQFTNLIFQKEQLSLNEGCLNKPSCSSSPCTQPLTNQQNDAEYNATQPESPDSQNQNQLLDQRSVHVTRPTEIVARQGQGQPAKIRKTGSKRSVQYEDQNNNIYDANNNNKRPTDAQYPSCKRKRLGYHDDTNEHREFRELVPEARKAFRGTRKPFEPFTVEDQNGEDEEMVHLGFDINITRDQWRYIKRKSCSASVFCKNLARSIYGIPELRKRCLKLKDKCVSVPDNFDDPITPPRTPMTPHKRKVIEFSLKYWLLKFKPHKIQFTIEGEIDKVGHYLTEEINYQIKEKKKQNEKDAADAARVAEEEARFSARNVFEEN